MSLEKQISDVSESSQACYSQVVPMQFSVAHSRIMHQTIELETLILNLDTGVYYSLEGVASVVWQLATEIQRVEQIVLLLEKQFGPIPELAKEVSHFLNQLVDEGLLKVIAAPHLEGAAAPNLETMAGYLGQRYTAPIFTRYVDLQDLLLADPIHELMDAT